MWNVIWKKDDDARQVSDRLSARGTRFGLLAEKYEVAPALSVERALWGRGGTRSSRRNG